MHSILVHYHEIALKRGNRPVFLRHLARNLIRATSDLGPAKVDQLTGRMVRPSESFRRRSATGRSGSPT